MSPIFTSPPSRPSIGVLIACARSGSAVTAKPAAMQAATKPRRSTCTSGSRLLRWSFFRSLRESSIYSSGRCWIPGTTLGGRRLFHSRPLGRAFGPVRALPRHDAEAMPAGILHHPPFLDLLHALRAELFQPRHLGVDVVGLDIEVHPFAARLDALDDEVQMRPRQVGVALLRRVLELAAQRLAPEPGDGWMRLRAGVDQDGANPAAMRHGRASCGGFSANHWAIAGMSYSEPPGMEKFRTPARLGPRFSKSCCVPAAASTKEPRGASIHRSPTRMLMVPSIT